MQNAWQPHAPRLTRAAEGDVYIPHPAPNAATLVIPAIISLILYLLISYLLVPAWKRYRNRYSQYLPLDAISTRTTSFRQRILGSLTRALLPASWREQFGRGRPSVNGHDGSGSDFDEDEGEELYDVDDNRRQALSLDARRARDDVEGRRLSRDLEEGFKDDSDDEDNVSDNRRRSISQ
ncbi:hypothetical protein LOCC1_G007988 [Lachnellula occidentalis]|uniref:Checkpoint protein hus1 n=1 Tax=Lachnellula occidentalis TaxID=215460 RepID=A0A8H8UAX5_9HELO|nr:hypothetical protein LOCC1_G007988 [Lachnellula occidentalis]